MVRTQQYVQPAQTVVSPTTDTGIGSMLTDLMPLIMLMMVMMMIMPMMKGMGEAFKA
jgi:CRISPR/Cas system-associated protein Cas7 (RAMP superfamily)